MTVEVVSLPTSIFPDLQVLVPARGPGQSMEESPFVGAQGVTTMRGSERWQLDLEFRDRTGDERAEISAFVTRLRISHNVFLCVNHTNPKRGPAFTSWSATGGSYQVAAVTSGGLQNMRIWWANTGVTPTSLSPLKAGDFFSVNCELKMLLVDMPPLESSHIGSVYFWPPLFSTVASGTRVEVHSAVGAFRAVDVMPLNTRPPGYITNVVIRAVERVNSAMVSEFL